MKSKADIRRYINQEYKSIEMLEGLELKTDSIKESIDHKYIVINTLSWVLDFGEGEEGE